MAPYSAQEFITKFHEIDGIKISERQKNFYKLLAEFAQLKDDAALLDEISSTLTPKNYLESLLKLDFLIYFKRTEDIFEYLKTGNDVFVSKIAKQVWFFKSAFNETPPEKLVNELLPNMSYCVRAKILSKLSRYVDDERFDLIFDAVAARYGIYLASKYITGCSAGKIKSIFENYIIHNLSCVDLKIIYQKDLELIRKYFENKSLCFTKQERFFKYLWVENLELYEELNKKLQVNVDVGRRVTKKFVATHKDDIIKSPGKFSHLNIKAIYRKLGKDSKDMIINSLPKKIDEIKYYGNDFRSICNDISKKYLYSTYFNIIQNHYNKKFADYPKLISKQLIEMIPNREEKSALAKIKIDDSADDFDEFVIYLKCDQAIPMIKNKINLTSDISDRCTLVKLLVQVCGANKDMKALLEVIKYFISRHRNDDKGVILTFLNAIDEFCDIKDFNEEIWKAIKDIVAIYSIKFEDKTSSDSLGQSLISADERTECCVLKSAVVDNIGYSDFERERFNSNPHERSAAYLQFLYKNNKLKDEQIFDFLVKADSKFFYSEFCKNLDKEYRTFIFNYVIKNSDKIAAKRDDDTSKIDYDCEWINIIDSKAYKDLKLNFYDFPSLVESFYQSARSSESVSSHICTQLRSKIFTLEPNPYKEKHLEIYWSDRFKKFFELKDLVWFLKYSPEILSQNTDKIQAEILSALQPAKFKRGKRIKMPQELKFILHWIKRFTHIDLDEQFIKHCISIIESDKKIDKIAHIRCLSILLSAEKYIELAEKYKPSSKKLDLKNEDTAKIFNLQCAIAENFKYTNEYKALDSLLNYMIGDFLPFALTSLSSLLHKTPEIKLDKYLTFLEESKAVSVRKHCLFFACQLCDAKKLSEIFKKWTEKETDASLQRRIFKSVINYFVKNPQESYFEMVKLNLNCIKEDDNESLNKMIESTKNMPQKFKSAFVTHAWEFLESNLTRQKSVLEFKKSLLDCICVEDCADFPLELALKIITTNIENRDDDDDDNTIMLDDIYNFALNILMGKEAKQDIMTTIFQSILKSKQKSKNTRGLIYNWTRAILIMKKNQDIEFTRYFIEFWKKELDPVKYFKDYIDLIYLQLKLEFRSEINVEQFCSKLVEYYSELIKRYGCLILRFLSDALEELIDNFATDEGVSRYDFYHFIINHYHSSEIAILVMSVLPDNDSYRSLNEKEEQLYKEMVKKLKRFDDDAVKINARYKFVTDRGELYDIDDEM